MSIVYRELINSTINKLSSSIKKLKKPMVLLTINGHKIKALYDTGADLCCMTAAKFRQVFPVEKRPKKLNVISTVTVASGDKLECLGVYQIPFKIGKKKFVYNVHVLNKLCDNFILGINFFNEADSLTIRRIMNSFGPIKTEPTGKLPNFNVRTNWHLSQPATKWSL
jgi:hypothetical protein